MKAIDEPIWAQQVEELRVDDIGKDFHDYLEFWVVCAERLMEEKDPQAPDSLGGFLKYSTEDAIRVAFSITEGELGRKSPVYVSQMLALLCVHWLYRDALFAGLTSIERYFVQVALEAKLAQLGKDAARND